MILFWFPHHTAIKTPPSGNLLLWVSHPQPFLNLVIFTLVSLSQSIKSHCKEYPLFKIGKIGKIGPCLNLVIFHFGQSLSTNEKPLERTLTIWNKKKYPLASLKPNFFHNLFSFLFKDKKIIFESKIQVNFIWEIYCHLNCWERLGDLYCTLQFPDKPGVSEPRWYYINVTALPHKFYVDEINRSETITIEGSNMGGRINLRPRTLFLFWNT